MCAKTIKINEGFVCGYCSEQVTPAAQTCRNHCPFCLWSLHVDGDIPGDRASDCRGLMEPVRLEQSSKGYVLSHRCQRCAAIKRNRVLADDCWEKIIELFHLGH